MVLKTATFFLWFAASYALLVLWATAWWTAVPLAISLGLSLAGIGFSVMHDGGHRAYSNRPGTNRLAALSLDLVGASSFVWHFKHNVLHHTYTNVVDADDDIEFKPFFRLTSSQPRRWFHRLQFLYWPLLLCFLTTKWILLDDLRDLARGHIAGHRMPRPSASDLLIVAVSKLNYLVWAFAIPLLFVDPLNLLAGYALATSVAGLVLGTVFQLAHAVEDASFFAPEEGAPLSLPWAEHQLATTVDFARANRLLTWYVGGLNHQVEHHLFPRVSHRHYPALAPLVRKVCARRGVPVLDHATFAGALGAHLRHLYRMGCPAVRQGAGDSADLPRSEHRPALTQGQAIG
ncbi:MAG: acyl-CoA desaturase [Planctomycetes bacterium]|nr:acyl-CoA desaturase [Planctomycetota bacterium]